MDIGLIADVYRHLGSLLQTLPKSEELILIPGKGWMRPKECFWHPLGNHLLQRCSRYHSLSDHYSRFDSATCEALQAWVPTAPGTDIYALCQALAELANCAKLIRADLTSPWGSRCCH